MSEIIVLVPTRGRPERAMECYRSFRETATLVTTRIVFGVDWDDPRGHEYSEAFGAMSPGRFGWDPDKPLLWFITPPFAGNLTKATNGLWQRFRDVPIIGTVNDDMLFRTSGWDRMVVEALADGPGIVYGNDLLQGEKLPTSPFMSREIPAALGWYALPTCEHLWIDNAWADIGSQADCIRYLPEMVIEHVHPFAGKAEWDANYERANNQAAIDRDKAAYTAWRSSTMFEDVSRVRAAIARMTV